MPVKSASEIVVGEFRQILVWPLRLVAGAVTSALDDLDRDQRWTRVDDPLTHLHKAQGEARSDLDYQEFVYFHPFVQRFLYSGSDEGMHLFRRGGIDSVTLDLGGDVTGAFQVTLAVDRLNLYVFDTGNAVLAVEVFSGDAANGSGAQVTGTSGPRAMTLAEAQVILERFRRLYPPYWDGEGVAGLSPRMVTWNDDRYFTMPGRDECVAAMSGPDRHPPLAGHWRMLIEPLHFTGHAPHDAAVWGHVVDERAPVLAYLAVDDPHAIGRGDWMRLAMLDEAGTATLPYGEDFMSEFETRHCYDRFWNRNQGSLTTRYLMSGYGFVAVGSANDPMFANHVRQHVRRHYFQMGLIAHFQTAALLTLSDRLSCEVARMKDGDLHNRSEKILHDVLAFTHRYWFPDISNHVQAREIYALWRRHLDVDSLYRQVTDEAQALNAYGGGVHAARLNKVAVAAVVPAVMSGILGINVVVGKQPVPALDWWTLGAAVAIGLLAWGWIRRHIR